jgi:hypothetical protein
MAAHRPDLEDLLPYASTSVAAGERRTEVKREDSLHSTIALGPDHVKQFGHSWAITRQS